MKKIKFLSLLLTALCLLSSLSVLSASAEEGEVRVTMLGNASVTAPAELATLRFEILSVSSVPSKAQKENKRLVDKLAATLADYGTLTRDGYYTGESFSGSRFLVTSCLSLTTSRVGEVEHIEDLLLDAGVSALLEVSYAVGDLASYKEEALHLAIADAQARASALGITDAPVFIHDHGCYVCPFPRLESGKTPSVRVECSVELGYR